MDNVVELSRKCIVCGALCSVRAKRCQACVLVDARTRSRRPRKVRAVTIANKRSPKRDLLIGAALYPRDPDDPVRPRTRGDCAGGERPCVWVGCKHNLYLDVSPETGSIKANFPDLEPDKLTHSCVLDIADEGGMTLEAVGRIMNLTRERIRQLETRALERLQRPTTRAFAITSPPTREAPLPAAALPEPSGVLDDLLSYRTSEACYL